VRGAHPTKTFVFFVTFVVKALIWLRLRRARSFVVVTFPRM
jgi:hypothetical protein